MSQRNKIAKHGLAGYKCTVLFILRDPSRFSSQWFLFSPQYKF